LTGEYLRGIIQVVKFRNDKILSPCCNAIKPALKDIVTEPKAGVPVGVELLFQRYVEV
jgi:hypothetical protein